MISSASTVAADEDDPKRSRSRSGPPAPSAGAIYTERLLHHIRMRGRSYEQDIKAEYLESINQGYLDYIKSQTGLNILIIDVTHRDFVKNQEDYIWLLEQINAKVV